MTQPEIAAIAPTVDASAHPAAPAPSRTQFTTPNVGASFDDITPPTDTTCRSGYNVGQAKTC